MSLCCSVLFLANKKSHMKRNLYIFCIVLGRWFLWNGYHTCIVSVLLSPGVFWRSRSLHASNWYCDRNDCYCSWNIYGELLHILILLYLPILGFLKILLYCYFQTHSPSFLTMWLVGFKRLFWLTCSFKLFVNHLWISLSLHFDWDVFHFHPNLKQTECRWLIIFV